MSRANPVICLVEVDEDGAVEASRRALSVARGLAASMEAPVEAAVVGDASDAVVASLGQFGVTTIHAARGAGFDAYAPGAWARALTQLANSASARAIVAAGSDRGNEVLAHAGALSGLAMVANCFSATSDAPGVFSLSRQRWAGSLIEDSVLSSPLALLTVAFDGVAAEPAPAPSTPVVQDFHPELVDADLTVKVTEWTRRPGGVALADARVVVGGGRGVGSAENFAALDELAELLGAAVGVSRAVTSLGWRSHSQQVGQTGTRIAPDLYLVAGISGATQHLAGCQSAKVVVAINTDGDAPIISRADYAVIGDLNAIVPALVEAIKSR